MKLNANLKTLRTTRMKHQEKKNLLEYKWHQVTHKCKNSNKFPLNGVVILTHALIYIYI